jgi:acyl-CoA thioesterase-2
VDSPALWDGADLAALLRLQPAGEGRYEIACSESNTNGEVFGGQYLGQALSAALATGRRRSPHAMHAFFLRAARADRPMQAQVECVRDGRSFSHRRVTFMQDAALVFCADVSLHDEEPGGASHQCAPPDVPAPDALHNLDRLFADHGEAVIGAEARSRMTRKKTAEIRPVDPLAGFVQPGTDPRSSVWLRARQFADPDPLQHYAALAYLSDLWSNAACRITHGRTLFGGETGSASLNHSIWFHRQPSVTDWFLFATDSPSTHGGTGFNRGALFERGGRLVASVAQEALVRPPRSST